MAFAKRKEKTVDPISDRARALNAQIAALESEIKKLDTQLQHTPTPRFRSTAMPHGATIARAREPSVPPPRPVHEPVFEEVRPLRADDEIAAPDQFNDLGVRKFDLPALLNRLRRQFSRPESGNQRLVTYLAAGGVRGLRPLRYEKRVARNRFIALVIILLVILLGVFSIFLHNH
jgi:cell division protein FtsB